MAIEVWSRAVALAHAQMSSIPVMPLVRVFYRRHNPCYCFIHHPIVQDSSIIYSAPSRSSSFYSATNCFVIILFSDQLFYLATTRSCTVFPFRLHGYAFRTNVKLVFFLVLFCKNGSITLYCHMPYVCVHDRPLILVFGYCYDCSCALEPMVMASCHQKGSDFM